MKAFRSFVLFGCLSMLLISCTGAAELGTSGYITMMPYMNDQIGFRGVFPQNWQESSAGQFEATGPNAPAQLVLVGEPDLALADVEALAASQLGLEALPAKSKRYTSPSLAWDIYEFPSNAFGVRDVQVLLALAEGEQGSYAVAVLAIMDTYNEDVALYETIFLHAIHGFMPIE